MSFINLIDTQAVEFHSVIDVAVVTAMAIVGLVQLFFG